MKTRKRTPPATCYRCREVGNKIAPVVTVRTLTGNTIQVHKSCAYPGEVEVTDSVEMQDEHVVIVYSKYSKKEASSGETDQKATKST